jgi:hypothetical protein
MSIQLVELRNGFHRHDADEEELLEAEDVEEQDEDGEVFQYNLEIETLSVDEDVGPFAQALGQGHEGCSGHPISVVTITVVAAPVAPLAVLSASLERLCAFVRDFAFREGEQEEENDDEEED